MAVLFLTTLFLLWPGIVEYASTQTVHMHWSRLIAGTFTLFSLLQTAVFAVLMKVISIWQHERSIGPGRENVASLQLDESGGGIPNQYGTSRQ